MTIASDIETQVAHRKQMLIAEIREHKTNSSRAGAAEAVDKIKAKLSELEHIVKAGVVNGWANVGPDTTLQLEEWISR